MNIVSCASPLPHNLLFVTQSSVIPYKEGVWLSAHFEFVEQILEQPTESTRWPFITVQNLVVIASAVLIIVKFEYFACLA